MAATPAVKADIHGAIIGLGILGAIANQNSGNRGSSSSNRGSGVSQAQRQQNRDVQSALNGFGFPVGTVDGALGPRSRGAIGDYQQYMGYPRTGYLDDQQRGFLLESHNRMRNGAGQAYPQVVAAEGTKGLLKAFRDPQWAAQYGATNFPDPQVARGTQVPGQYGAPGTVGVQNPVPSAIPSAIPPATTQAAGAVPPISIPPIPGAIGQVKKSMAERCELVTLMTQTNQGAIQAAAMSDPDQALSEKFCEARGYAMSVAQSYAAQLRVSDDQLLSTCTQITEALAPARNMVGSGGVEAVSAEVTKIGQSIGLGDPANAGAYGQLCLGIGYRQDDADMALSGALLAFSIGQMPYGEVMAHHLREGFGLTANVPSAVTWYDTALGALEQNAQPAFLPSQSAERVSVMRAALKSGRLQAVATPGLPPVVPAGGAIPALPVLPQ
ncbi:peptidoglycan-binding domain-containing protein [Tropicimonas sp. S265A]|uniref:peptidoglycan-binding domain-containing protein n=1 Tax=Tropicimonas sp. S265A TaxID=3415134 RepID=UPI003C7AD416